MKRSRALRPQVLLVSALLALLCLTAIASPARADARAGVEPPYGQCSGYYYTVRSGETWSSIARRTGVPVSVLRAANPQASRPRDVIYAGERLCIPATGAATQGGGATPSVTEQGGYWYQVKPGDTWNKVARATGIPVQQLLDANRQLVNRRLWLYIGQRIWIPAPSKGAPAVTQTPMAQAPATLAPATPSPVLPTEAQPVTAPTEAPSSTPVPTAVPMATSTATLAPLPTASTTPLASPQALTTPVPPTAALPPLPADCPKTLPAYGEAIASYLNKAENTSATLRTWLAGCRAGAAEAVTVAPITGPKSADVIAVVHDPLARDANPPELLLVYHKGPKGYSLTHKHEGQGRIILVQAADINADGRVEVVYSDRSCGAHTCFGTLFVDSWDGKAYQDWITDEPTIADPEYPIKDVTPEGQGSEIVMHGGVIGSVGAGPQRAWTETYTSPKGAPYVLFSQVYDPSTCLYFKILDANRAFDAWALNGFDPAIEAYKAPIADQAAEPCGAIKDEVATLRDFARFRLLVAFVASGQATQGLPLPAQITNKALSGAAKAFMDSYEANGSVIQACRDANKYAASNTGSWQFLADWGYANPSFTAQDLCPLD